MAIPVRLARVLPYGLKQNFKNVAILSLEFKPNPNISPK